MQPRNTLILMVFIFFATACTVVPGSHMKRSLLWFDETPPEYKPASLDIQYIPINTTVVSHLAEAVPPAATQNDKLQHALNNYEYRIGPGDVLTIIVWEHPELTIPAGSFRSAAEGGNEVKTDGTIFYPYAGKMHVEGLTTSEVKDLVASKLAAVIRRPQVDVRVADYRSQRVYVTGSVVKSGVVPITSTPLTLIDAIEASGGLTDTADWKSVLLTRGSVRYRISLQSLYDDGLLTENRMLEDGDIVHIPRNETDKIFVLGEVNLPQSHLMSRYGTSLADALSAANGINENRADGRGIYVLRNASIDKDEDGMPVYRAQVFHLDASSAMGFVLADQFPLEARDVVYVSAAPITRWNRFMSQLLPSIAGANSASRIHSRD